MNRNTATLAALAGMVGGPMAAVSILETAQNHILGGPDAKGELWLPRPRDKETLAVTQSWGFIWPENPEDQIYNRNMTRRQELTVPVTVPAGWTIKSTDHWLYKNLIDPAGQVRASLMLHTQDHDSCLSLVHKYRVTHWQKKYSDEEPIWPVIQDSNHNIVWIGPKIEADPGYRDRMEKFWKDRHAGKTPGKKEPQSPMDRAHEDGRLRLRMWDINPADPKWFEQGFEFPPLDDTRPKVKAYQLYTEFRHRPNDHYACDQGSSELLAADDKEAIAEVELTKKRGSGYHRKWRLYASDGKEIWRGEDARPNPKMLRGKNGYTAYGGWRNTYDRF